MNPTQKWMDRYVDSLKKESNNEESIRLLEE